MTRGFIKWENKQNPLESEVIPSGFPLSVIHFQIDENPSAREGLSKLR